MCPSTVGKVLSMITGTTKKKKSKNDKYCYMYLRVYKKYLFYVYGVNATTVWGVLPICMYITTYVPGACRVQRGI